jgi:hypothetical protein
VRMGVGNSVYNSLPQCGAGIKPRKQTTYNLQYFHNNS